MVIHPDGHVVGDLLKSQRHLFQASDVVVVVLDRVEGQLWNQLGKVDLQAVELS